MSRRIFVGDVQGCREELEALLEAVRYDPAGDEVHPTGDLVNRGPDSLGVLRLCRELRAGGVLGNHDLHLLRQAAGLRRARLEDTLDAVFAAPDKQQLLSWLAERPFLRVWSDLYLVHAGLHPHWHDPEETLEGRDPLVRDEVTDFATRVRWCDAQGARPKRDHPPPGPPFEPWFHFYPRKEPKQAPRVVFGHWATRGLVEEPLLRGLDTGCVWGGALTAWIAEEDRLVSVPARKTWCRPGR